MTALVTAGDLKRSYEIKQGWFRKPAHLHAVGGISFELNEGRTLAVVGESGCGKSTLARLVTLIEEPTAGTLTLDGVDAVQGFYVKRLNSGDWTITYNGASGGNFSAIFNRRSNQKDAGILAVELEAEVTRITLAFGENG